MATKITQYQLKKLGFKKPKSHDTYILRFGKGVVKIAPKVPEIGIWEVTFINANQPTQKRLVGNIEGLVLVMAEFKDILNIPTKNPHEIIEEEFKKTFGNDYPIELRDFRHGFPDWYAIVKGIISNLLNK